LSTILSTASTTSCGDKSLGAGLKIRICLKADRKPKKLVFTGKLLRSQTKAKAIDEDQASTPKPALVRLAVFCKHCYPQAALLAV
jgi:hypothetical protein